MKINASIDSATFGPLTIYTIRGIMQWFLNRMLIFKSEFQAAQHTFPVALMPKDAGTKEGFVPLHQRNLLCNTFKGVE